MVEGLITYTERAPDLEAIRDFYRRGLSQEDYSYVMGVATTRESQLKDDPLLHLPRASLYVLARDNDGVLVGIGQIYKVGNQEGIGEIGGIVCAVRSDRKRQGIGRNIAIALGKAAIEEGYGALIAIINPTNTSSIGLARRFGFQQYGERDTWFIYRENIINMLRTITPVAF